MPIPIETAWVYVEGHRRYLTKRGACVARAHNLIKKRCECEGPDYYENYPGNTCGYHREPFYSKLNKRLLRHLLYINRIKKESPHAD